MMEPDAGEFRLLVEQWQDRVFRLVSSVLGPYREADAEDITQEVFLQVYRKISGLRDRTRIGAWVYQLARNRAIDARRRARFRLPHLPIDGLLEGARDTIEQRLWIAECMEALPETYRTLLYMHYWQDAPLAEIAEATGLVEGTVKSYLARARQRVREHLAGKGVALHV